MGEYCDSNRPNDDDDGDDNAAVAVGLYTQPKKYICVFWEVKNNKILSSIAMKIIGIFHFNCIPSAQCQQ